MDPDTIHDPRLILVLDYIEDPGAVGTVLRSAQALQWQGVWFLPHTPDPWHHQVVKASSGALFHMPYMQGDLQNLLAFIESKKMELCVAHGMGRSPETHKFGKGCALLVRQEHVAYISFFYQNFNYFLFFHAAKFNFVKDFSADNDLKFLFLILE